MVTDACQAVVFDWGDTIMRCFEGFEGPMQTWPKVEAVAGIAAALAILKPRFTIALATNAVDSDEQDIRLALDRCNLGPWFDHIFCFRRVGRRKPEPEFYRAILEGLDLPASHVCMVGDSLDGDVIAANAVGMPAVWFNEISDREETRRLCCTVHGHDELVAALRKLGFM